MERGGFRKGILTLKISDMTSAYIPLSMTQSHASFKYKEAWKCILVNN